MLIAIVILASILMIVWLLLLGMVNNEDWVAAATNIEKQNSELQSGNFRGVSILPMPGYAMQRRIPSITNGSIYRTVMEKSIELRFLPFHLAFVRYRMYWRRLVVGIAQRCVYELETALSHSFYRQPGQG